MKTKLILTGLLFACLVFNLVAVERLNMFVEVKRYLDDNNNTKFVIDYQVPYKNLTFLTRDKGFFAELKVSLAISYEDSVLVTKEFTDNIGVSRKYDVTSSNKSYFDRISLTLAKPKFLLEIKFLDLNAEKEYVWTYTTEQLSKDDKLSDIELISTISSDTLLYSQKFVRDWKTYLPEPSGMISREIYDSVYFYCVAYNTSTDNAKAVLTIYRDKEPVFIKTYNLQNSVKDQQILFPVGISSMKTGKYTTRIELTDGEVTFDRTSDFILTEQTEQLFFNFSDPEDDYKLIRYIASPKSSSDWNTMSIEARRRYVSSFWTSLAAMNNISVDTLLKIYKDRIDYSNAHFSHFVQGWKTDMGRIYIRNGRPDDIEGDVESLTSSDDTRFVRKDYQIWKYNSSNKPVYLFVDKQMNGNFELVYANNDDKESTTSDWKKYLGNDFDESILEN